MYNECLEYVRDYLRDNNGDISNRPNQQFRSRIAHTKRVFNWAKIISEDLDINREALYLAAIFHDVGYGCGDDEYHAKKSASIFKEYGILNNIQSDLIDYTSYLIENHSEKNLIESDIPLELVLLMEADLLDEEGTLRILWDSFIVGKSDKVSYEEAYRRIIEGSKNMPRRLVTRKTNEILEKKLMIFEEFLNQLENDLFLKDNI